MKPWRRPIIVEDHTHDWKPTGATFRPPASKVKFANMDEDFLDLLIMGETVLTQECQVCHRIDTTRHRGQIDLSAYGLKW